MRTALMPISDAARAQGRTDVVALWSGQGAPLIEHNRAAELYAALVEGTSQLLKADASGRRV